MRTTFEGLAKISDIGSSTPSGRSPSQRFSGHDLFGRERWTLTIDQSHSGWSTLRWRCATSRSTMPGIYSTGRWQRYLGPLSSGISTRIWRRCWGTSLAVDRSSRGGWSGSRMSRPGILISSLSWDTRRLIGLGRLINSKNCLGLEVEADYRD